MIDLVKTFFTTALVKNTPYLILFSAISGAVITKFCQWLFGVVFTDYYRDVKASKATIKKYRNPIIQAADSLRARIDNFITNHRKGWFSESEYYKLSTLYAFCVYFCWVEIFFGEFTKFQFESLRSNRRLQRLLKLVAKTFNNFNYFVPLPKRFKPKNVSDIPRYICKALGEIMITKNENGECVCLNFNDFTYKYKNDSVFRSWILNIEQFIANAKDEYININWDRLQLIELSLISLIDYLDPKHVQSRKYSRKKIKQIIGRLSHPNAYIRFRAEVAKITNKGCRWCYPFPTFYPWFKKVYHFINWLVFPNKIARQKPVCISEEFNITSDEVSTGKNRYELYSRITDRVRLLTKKNPFGSIIKITLRFSEPCLSQDTFDRMPENISLMTKRIVKTKDISIKEEYKSTNRG